MPIRREWDEWDDKGNAQKMTEHWTGTLEVSSMTMTKSTKRKRKESHKQLSSSSKRKKTYSTPKIPDAADDFQDRPWHASFLIKLVAKRVPCNKWTMRATSVLFLLWFLQRTTPRIALQINLDNLSIELNDDAKNTGNIDDLEVFAPVTRRNRPNSTDSDRQEGRRQVWVWWLGPWRWWQGGG